MTRSAEDALIEEHERYMRQVHESGMPTWMLDYYAKSNAQWQEEEHLRNNPNTTQDESNKQNPTPDDTGDDPHLFI